MVTLICALVGAEVGAEVGAFHVDIDGSKLVGELKVEIKEKESIACPTRFMDLFLAKKGDAWLPSDDPAARKLAKGRSMKKSSNY